MKFQITQTPTQKPYQVYIQKKKKKPYQICKYINKNQN